MSGVKVTGGRVGGPNDPKLGALKRLQMQMAERGEGVDEVVKVKVDNGPPAQEEPLKPKG